MNRKAFLAATLLSAAALSGTAIAATPAPEENTNWRQTHEAVSRDYEQLVHQPKISMGHAVSVAERHAEGKAVKAELEREQGKSVFEVQVLKGDKLSTVFVDPHSGKVLTAMVDQPDHEQTGAHEDHDKNRK
jgi:uncharacterized membrane protein YkoI